MQIMKYIHVTDKKTIPKYSITTKGTQCSYCCCADCSCAEGETLFNIFSNALRIYSGNILKRSFNQIEKIIYFMILISLMMLHPKKKVLIICATISIDNVVYKELGSNI